MILKAIGCGFKITAKKHQTLYIYERFKIRICECRSSKSLRRFMARQFLGFYNASCIWTGGFFFMDPSVC
jgi:hypothetical protein